MWLFIGLITGIAVLGLIMLLRSRNVSVKWYEWLIGAVGLALLLFTIQNFTSALFALEPTASWMVLLIFGLLSLVLLAVAWQLISRRQRAAG